MEDAGPGRPVVFRVAYSDADIERAGAIHRAPLL